jgi:hypothetical protein
MMAWEVGMMKTGMRAAVLLLVLLAASSGAARGQGALTVAPRVGFVVSTMLFEDPATDAQTETFVGAQVGVSAGLDLGRFFTGEIGLQLSREGFGGGGAHTGALRRDQLAAPLLLSARMPTRISLRLTAGVTGKVALDCRLTGVAEVGELPCDDAVMGAVWKRLDVEGVAGVGVAIPLKDRILSADARISRGLRDLNGGGFIPGSVHALSIGVTVAVFSPWRAGSVGGAS